MHLPRPRFSLAQFLLLIALVTILLATGVTLVRHRRQQAGVWTTAVQFSPDGRTLAVAVRRPDGPASVLLWDLHNRSRRGTLTGSRNQITSLAFTPDSTTLATGSGPGQPAEILLWDVVGGKLRARLTAHANWVTSIAMSHDGKTMATSGIDGTARLWDVVAARELSTLASSTAPLNRCTVAMAPDGRTFAWTDGFGNIAIRDINTLETIATLKTDLPAICLTFSPDGELLAAVEWDSGTFGSISHLKLWNVSTESVVRTFDPGRYGASDAVFSPDGRKLAATAGQFVRVWDVKSGEETQRFQSAGSIGRSLAFSPDGETLAVGALLWHLPTDTFERITVAEEHFSWYPIVAGFLAWAIAAASVRQRRFSHTSVFLGLVWAVPAVALFIVFVTDPDSGFYPISMILDCGLLMFGLVAASLRAQRVGLYALFLGERLWAFKGLCMAAFLILNTTDRVVAGVPLLLNLLSIFAVIAVFRIRTDRARGAPWQHWVGLAVAIVEPMVLVALFAFPNVAAAL